MASGYPVKYTQPMLDWVRANQADIPRSELTILFNTKFNMGLGAGTLAALCKREGWQSNLDAKFTKGTIPWNKDKKGYMGANATSFKKGQKVHNHKPVGSERICSKDGYILVKVAEPRKWQGKHIVVWESANGKLPDNHCIRFLDNDRTNCKIDNLICVSRAVHAVVNKQNPANSDNADINHAIILTETLRHTVKTRI